MTDERKAHTPGPWAYRLDPTDDWGWVRDARNCIVATARNPDAGDLSAYRKSKTDPYEANARLIAAAPVLLEALDWLLASVERSPSEENYPGDREERLLLACGLARRTIASATGEDQ